MNCRIYATSFHSVFDISDGLRRLKVSHSVVNRGRIKHVDLGFKQKLPVRVGNDVNSWDPKSVNFIVSSMAEISLTNFPRLGTGDVQEDLSTALNSGPSVIPCVKTMGMHDYVNWLAKPSILNKIQTEVYKIQPYSLRKQTQALVLDFFNSRISVKRMLASLQDNMKHDGLASCIPDAVYLRDAVARLQTEDLTKVSLETGVPTFELLYLSKIREVKK